MRVAGVALAGLVFLVGMSAAHAKPGVYCRTVTGEVEGFGQGYTRSTAERSRDKAVSAERARWREMRREIVKVEARETECKAVYPLGFEEWHCIARTDVCVAK